jgi:outer membrane protein assembly factor BamB
MRPDLSYPAIAAILLGATAAATASSWPNHRGPHHDGTGDPSLKLPAKFSPTEGVTWSIDLPGPSAATPCVAGGKVFLTAAVEGSNSLKALCYDVADGKLLWEKELSRGRIALDDRSNLASPSPATDGERVVFYFGTGDLLVTDFDGEVLWEKNVIGSDDYYFAFQWTYSTSPLVHDGQVIIQVLQRDTAFEHFDYQRGKPGDDSIESYLVAYDTVTGEQKWKSERPSEAVAESREAFSSPVVYVGGDGGRPVLLVAGGDAISGHDPGSGKELWRWGTWNPEKIGHWRLVPSPVAGAGVALACAPKQAPVYAVSASDGKLLWKSSEPEVSSDVCTPLFHDGFFYILNGDFKDKRISCVEPATGKVRWTGEIGTRAKIECSPTCGDGKIYFLDHNGTAFVVAANPEKFELLHSTEFGSNRVKNLRSAIALAEDSLFIRTHDKLYRIGG